MSMNANIWHRCHLFGCFSGSAQNQLVHQGSILGTGDWKQRNQTIIQFARCFIDWCPGHRYFSFLKSFFSFVFFFFRCSALLMLVTMDLHLFLLLVVCMISSTDFASILSDSMWCVNVDHSLPFALSSLAFPIVIKQPSKRHWPTTIFKLNFKTYSPQLRSNRMAPSNPSCITIAKW